MVPTTLNELIFSIRHRKTQYKIEIIIKNTGFTLFCLLKIVHRVATYPRIKKFKEQNLEFDISLKIPRIFLNF